MGLAPDLWLSLLCNTKLLLHRQSSEIGQFELTDTTLYVINLVVNKLIVRHLMNHAFIKNTKILCYKYFITYVIILQYYVIIFLFMLLNNMQTKFILIIYLNNSFVYNDKTIYS